MAIAGSMRWRCDVQSAGRNLCLMSVLLVSQAAFIVQDDAPSPSPPVHAPSSSDSPYSLLNPSAFTHILGEDFAWAIENIPLWQSSNATLDAVYYFRWRTFKSHIHPTGRTDGIDWVVTEVRCNKARASLV